MSHMKLKKVKRNGIKLFILLIIIYVSFIYTFYYSFKNIYKDTNSLFIKFLINNNTSINNNTYELPKLVNKTFNYLLKIDFTKPYTLFNDSVFGYAASDNVDNKELAHLKEVSYYLVDPSTKEIKEPIIYLYNTHQLENYNNDNLSKLGITPNVLMMSYLLKEKLNNLNIPTIVEDTNITEFLKINNWDYSNSYRASRVFILDKQNTYPSLKYFIDIHRDSVGHNITTTSINGKDYARILFVIGLEHNNYQANLSLSNKLNDLFEKHYPGISRGIYKKEGPNVNGIYNQDISPNVILIEVGGIDNNTIEVMNTINAMADILSIYLGDNSEK